MINIRYGNYDMKSFKHYIAESVHLYEVTIKVAGEIDKDFLDMFIYNLNKFSPAEKIVPKTLPIQKDPYGFPNVHNEPVTILKCKFRYPCTEPMVQQMAQLLGYNVNMVRLVNSTYDDSINSESEQYANQMEHSPVLTHEEMEDAGNAAKKASKDYGDSYLNSIKDQSKDGFQGKDLQFDAKRTPDAFDPFKPYTDDKSGGNKSPLSTIKRPSKPKTGAMSRG
jgi:hypothetical protein